MSSADAMTAAYEAIARKAWDKNRARAAELSSLLADWTPMDPLASEGLERARAVAHSLRGSAGTFGHNDASRAAEELETLLGGPAQDGDVGMAAALMVRIHTALASEPVLES
jgi:chemotaxis protein histidine kinase CheA